MMIYKIASKETRTNKSGEVVPDHVFTGHCKVVAMDNKNVYVQAGHCYNGSVPYVETYEKAKYNFFDEKLKQVVF